MRKPEPSAQTVRNVLQRLHVQVRLLGLLVFAVLLPWQSTTGLLVAAGLIALLLLDTGKSALPALASLRRIRWLLLSLAVLYLGFTPGEALLPSLGDWSPTTLGVKMLLERAAVLVMMLLLALLVLRASGREELAAGMQRLLGPLCRTGLLPKRLPQRFGLLFHEVDQIEARVKETRRDRAPFMQRAAALWTSLEEIPPALENTSGDGAYELPRVPAWQWGVPLVILACGIVGIYTGA
ncbi:MAG: hypothetical protein R3270_01285 [Gammaproteobacteria bacterium]|nr:hypothetical protein [Gammaproteobacteria bacterium]